MTDGPFAVYFCYNGKHIGSHSSISTLARADEIARDAVFGDWTCANAARIYNASDRVVGRYDNPTARS